MGIRGSRRQLPIALSLDTTENSWAPFSLHPPIRYWYTWARSLKPSLHQDSQSSSQPSLLRSYLFSRLFLECPCLSCPGELKNAHRNAVQQVVVQQNTDSVMELTNTQLPYSLKSCLRKLLRLLCLVLMVQRHHSMLQRQGESF